MSEVGRLKSVFDFPFDNDKQWTTLAKYVTLCVEVGHIHGY